MVVKSTWNNKEMFITRFLAVSQFCIVSFGNNDLLYREAEMAVGNENSFLDVKPDIDGSFYGLLDCCHKCLSMGSCRSMNTKPTTSGFICQFLMTTSSIIQSPLKYSQGWTYYEYREVSLLIH